MGDPFLWATLPLVGALLLAAVVISLAKRWRQRAAFDQLTASEQLARFRTLYERGEMSPQEFQRVRGLLLERIRRELEAGRITEVPLEIVTLEPEPPSPPGDGKPEGPPPSAPPA